MMLLGHALTPNVLGLRGETIETQHTVSVAVSHAEDGLLWQWGVPDASDAFPLFLRSAAKPFQAATLWRLFGASLREQILTTAPEILALMQASHTGTAEHVTWVKTLLSLAELDENALRCPKAWPLDRASRQADTSRGLEQEPTRLTHNCSGKHAGMLVACREQGWSIDDYDAMHHPLQQAILSDLAAFCETSVETIVCSTDGCGVPVHAIPWSSAALIYARLPEAEQLVRAMQRYPNLMGGAGRVDSEVLRVTQGRILAKVGADGVLAASYPEKKRGLMFKLWDGQLQLRNALFLAVLQQQKWLSPEEYEALIGQTPEWACVRKTDAGKEIGRYVLMTE